MNIFNNIKVYITSNIPNFLIGIISAVFIWLFSFFWQANTERIDENTKSNKEIAAALQSLALSLGKNEIRLQNVERRVTTLEDYKAKHEEEVRDFWENYYVEKK